MKNRKKIAIMGVIISAVFVFVVFIRYNAHYPGPAAIYNLSRTKISEQEIIAAACPTFYYLLEELNNSGIGIIKTDSTAQSLYYLHKNKADFIISGRTLAPGEPAFPSEVIGSGYSFISSQTISVLDEDMGDYKFFTDLPVENILDKFPYISKSQILKVDNVYSYLEDGIGITSAENTDYSRSSIVNIYRNDNSRHRFSRTPIIYYSKFLAESDIEQIAVIVRDGENSRQNMLKLK